MQTVHIIHRDPDFLVVNIPGGLLSFPGRGPDKQDCVMNRIKSMYPNGISNLPFIAWICTLPALCCWQETVKVTGIFLNNLINELWKKNILLYWMGSYQMKRASEISLTVDELHSGHPLPALPTQWLHLLVENR